MSFSLRKPRNVGDVGVLIALAGLVLWYYFDARDASGYVLNLVLILPVTAIVLLLCSIEFFRSTFFSSASVEDRDAESVTNVIPVVSLFATYVLTLPWLGFDVGTCLFIASFLWLHGERRWRWVMGYSISFASLTSLFLAFMLPYPMPMSVFPA